MNTKDPKIVCLGGGIGTVNLLRGIKEYSKNITVVVSMADDGGSAGRLRRFFSIPPPGDLINCIAAMSNAEPLMKELLTYRFSGNRYGSDRSLPGHKLGNLIMVALTSITGDFNNALFEIQRIFRIRGKILPSTVENLSIHAITNSGDTVSGEENIDLGRFTGKIEKVFLKPARASTSKGVVEAILEADVIITGPGDLYTTILPVLLVPQILKAIKESRAKKYFIVNVANKPFETAGYTIDDYVNAIIKHCKSKVFDVFFVNSNTEPPIPKKFKHQYVYATPLSNNGKSNYKIVKKDLIDESFPLYHDPEKLAKVIIERI